MLQNRRFGERIVRVLLQEVSGARRRKNSISIFSKRGPKAKPSTFFLWNIIANLMEKEPCTKFCGVLLRFLEVIKLQSIEFSVSDVIPANVQNIFHWFSLLFCASFM